MKSLKVPCFLIDDKYRDKYLRDGYTPLALTTQRDKQRHKLEWKAVLESLNAALSQHWTRGIGSGDYFLDSDVIDDRLLCVEVLNDKMLDERLVKLVHEVVLACDHLYSIDICDSWGFLNDKRGTPYPHFNIFVERERILIFSESKKILDKCGIADATRLP